MPIARTANPVNSWSSSWDPDRMASTRYFQVAGITIRVTADLPMTSATFDARFTPFQVTSPGAETVTVHHHFGLPTPEQASDERVVYRESPWIIAHSDHGWVYEGRYAGKAGERPFMHALWTDDHSCGHLYHADDARFLRGGLRALTLMPTDQVLLGQLLANRHGCLIHAAGMSLWGKGVLFIGHSDAGKSTTVTMLRDHGDIPCDDRIAVRRMADGFHISGTWCHGTVSDISPATVPLHALYFIEQAQTNAAIPLTDRREVLARLLPCLIRPLATADWWTKTLACVEGLLREVPAYRLLLDRSGCIADVLRTL